MPIYEKTGARWALPEFRYCLAQSMRSQGEVEGARTKLIQARTEAAEMQLHRIHWRILASLAELEAERGDTAAAAGLRRHGGEDTGMFSCSKATNEMNFMAQKFARTVLHTNNIDSCNRT